MTAERVRVVPFDLDALVRGDAYAVVSTGDQSVSGILETTFMLQPTGEIMDEPPSIELARRARTRRHNFAVLLVGWMTHDGADDAAIVAELRRRNLLRASDDGDPLRSVKRWRAAYRRL